MSYNYDNLWNLVRKYGLSKTEFKDKVNISTATLAKLSKNEDVSFDVIARICDFFNCNVEEILTYRPVMFEFREKIRKKIKDIDLTVYAEDWPMFSFEFTDLQAKNFSNLDHDGIIKAKITEYEYAANAEHPRNEGIIGATKYRFYGLNNEFVIQGSFTVIENFMFWLAENI